MFYLFGILIAAVALVIAVFYYLIFLKPRPRQEIPFDPDYEKIRGADYPPPYPNGWFSLCSSKDLKKAQVIEADAFGQKLAVYRAEDGTVGVVDVYCPHLNANLAGGKVVGNHLVCPFHGWAFNKDGECTHIPYCDKIPRHAKVHSWTVREAWGLIMVWYHSEGAAPSWSTEGFLPELPKYRFHARHSSVLRIHLQDFAENGADYAHFHHVHNLITIPLLKELVDVEHKVEIEFYSGDRSHMAAFTDQADLVWKKSRKMIPHAGGKARVTFFGPGFLVFEFFTAIGQMLLIKTFTPIGPLKVKMEDFIYAPTSTPTLTVKYLMGEASAQFHDDIAIWERKNFARKPLLVQGDGPILKMRQWYSQFYSQGTADFLKDSES
jgi:cholesterol 7-dehydrogenase